MKPHLKRQRLTPEVALLVDAASGEPRAVSSSFPRSTWTSRAPGDMVRLPHPGMALLIGDRWFEVMSESPDPQRRGATLYHVQPWEERFPLRLSEEISPEACRAAAQAYREREERLRKGHRLRQISFLTGLLPEADQERLELEYGVPADRATFVSAAPLLAGSVLALFAGFAASKGHSFGDWTTFVRSLWEWRVLFFYLALESMARLNVSLSTEGPIGSVFLVAPIRGFRFARWVLRGGG